jgi:hypothetical protein
MFQSLQREVAGESWRSFLTVFVGTWLAVWFYAAVHNQYLIRIAPEHFTVWHYRIPFTQDYTLLGILYAGVASVTPGGILGLLLYVAGRLFDRPRITSQRLILSTAWVWLAVEVCAIVTGAIVWRTGQPLYPDSLYPAKSLGLEAQRSVTRDRLGAFCVGALAAQQ